MRVICLADLPDELANDIRCSGADGIIPAEEPHLQTCVDSVRPRRRFSVDATFLATEDMRVETKPVSFGRSLRLS